MKEQTNDGKNGGLLEGKSHSEGGIKAVVTDNNNQPVELEGNEIIINKVSAEKHCEVLSEINVDGGGVEIPCDDLKSKTQEPIMANGGVTGTPYCGCDEGGYFHNKYLKIIFTV